MGHCPVGFQVAGVAVLVPPAFDDAGAVVVDAVPFIVDFVPAGTHLVAVPVVDAGFAVFVIADGVGGRGGAGTGTRTGGLQNAVGVKGVPSAVDPVAAGVFAAVGVEVVPVVVVLDPLVVGHCPVGLEVARLAVLAVPPALDDAGAVVIEVEPVPFRLEPAGMEHLAPVVVDVGLAAPVDEAGVAGRAGTRAAAGTRTGAAAREAPEGDRRQGFGGDDHHVGGRVDDRAVGGEGEVGGLGAAVGGSIAVVPGDGIQGGIMFDKGAVNLAVLVDPAAGFVKPFFGQEQGVSGGRTGGIEGAQPVSGGRSPSGVNLFRRPVVQFFHRVHQAVNPVAAALHFPVGLSVFFIEELGHISVLGADQRAVAGGHEVLRQNHRNISLGVQMVKYAVSKGGHRLGNDN